MANADLLTVSGINPVDVGSLKLFLGQIVHLMSKICIIYNGWALYARMSHQYRFCLTENVPQLSLETIHMGKTMFHYTSKRTNTSDSEW